VKVKPTPQGLKGLKLSFVVLPSKNVKFYLEQATKAQNGSRGIALLFL
jgi:hypothetical protein